MIVRRLPEATAGQKHGTPQNIGESYKIPKEDRLRAAKSLREYVEGIGNAHQYFNRAAEKAIYRRGGESCLSLTEIETLFNRVCCINRWTRETRLVEKITAMLGGNLEKSKALEKTVFEEAVRFAAQRGMPQSHAEEACVTIILDHHWAVNESMLDKWFNARRKQYKL